MTRNKKGFTLVELVIVIAVIAILAGVMVAVFSGVVRRANESAELQQVKNDELKQKAEDVLTKLDNANWFSWEDFENSLAAKLEQTYEKYASMNNGPTSDQIKSAVQDALEEYGKSAGQDNTALTEAQVKAIVENALANAKLGGVTENQVRTIVNTAVADINTVSKSDIQKIVDAATAKGLTAAQVAQVVADAKLASATSVSDLDTKVSQIITKLATVSENALTKEDIDAMIKKLLPVTDTVETADDFNAAVANWNSGSTIVVAESLKGTALTITTNDVKELNIKGLDETSNVTVNAPYATINFLSDVGTLTVENTAMNSVHVFGKVTNLTAKKGRTVVEEGAKVVTLTITAKDNVVVDIEKTAEVTGTLTVTETTGTVEVNNKGVVNAVAAGDTDAGKAVFNNIDEGKITNASSAETANGVTDNHIIIFDNEGNNPDVTYVSNALELRNALVAKAVYIAFKNNIQVNQEDGYVINAVSSCTIDGRGYTLSGYYNRVGNAYETLTLNWNGTEQIDVTVRDLTIENNHKGGRALATRGNLASLTLDGVTLKTPSVQINNDYHSYPLMLSYDNQQNFSTKVMIKDCRLETAKDGYCVIQFIPVDMTIENTTFVGWNALYFKSGSKNSTVVINDSELLCSSTHSGNSNGFGAIVFEDKDINVTVVDTFIDATAKGTASQKAVVFSSYWARTLSNTTLENIPVVFKGNTVVHGTIYGGSNSDLNLLVKLEGGTYMYSEWEGGENTQSYQAWIDASYTDETTRTYFENLGYTVVSMDTENKTITYSWEGGSVLDEVTISQGYKAVVSEDKTTFSVVAAD